MTSARSLLEGQEEEISGCLLQAPVPAEEGPSKAVIVGTEEDVQELVRPAGAGCRRLAATRASVSSQRLTHHSLAVSHTVSQQGGTHLVQTTVLYAMD